MKEPLAVCAPYRIGIGIGIGIGMVTMGYLKPVLKPGSDAQDGRWSV